MNSSPRRHTAVAGGGSENKKEHSWIRNKKWSSRNETDHSKSTEDDSEIERKPGEGLIPDVKKCERQKACQRRGFSFINYTPPAPPQTAKKNQHSNTQIMSWLLDNFVVTTQALPKELVFKKYVAMCKLQDKDPLLPSMFGKIVHRAFPGLRSSRTGTKGKAKHCYKGLSIRTGGNRVDEEDNKEVGTPPSTSQTWTERTSSTEPFRKSNLSSSPSSSSSFPSPEISSPSSSHSSLSTTLHSYDAISTPPNQSDLLDLGQDPFPRRPDISACSGSQGQRLTLPWLYQVVSNPNPNLPDSFYSRSISPSPQRWSSFFPPPYISPLSVPQSELPVERMILWQPFSSPMKKGLDPFADLDQLKYQPSTRPRPP